MPLGTFRGETASNPDVGFRRNAIVVMKKKKKKNSHGKGEEEEEEEEMQNLSSLHWGNRKRSRAARDAKPVVGEFLGFSKRLVQQEEEQPNAEKKRHPRVVSSEANGSPFWPCTPSPEEPPCKASLRSTPEPSTSVNEKYLGARIALQNNATNITATPLEKKMTKKKKKKKKLNTPAAPTCLQSGSPIHAHLMKAELAWLDWPKISVSLSRKEKEVDFMIMKGTKLPYRPKRRPKAVEKILYYRTPGNWLCDITKNRYEVREKNVINKKPSGLKAMESTESESNS